MIFFDISANVIAALLSACAGAVTLEAPSVAVIVDDIGYNFAQSQAAIDLPQAFSYAVLPFAPHSESLAERAHELGKDVIVHLPMEANDTERRLGPGALRLAMSQTAVETAVIESINAVPFAIGVNNHMGSRLTQESEPMHWIMQTLRARGGMLFVDSRTSSASVALQAARQAQLPAAARDVFLDNVRSTAHIQRQLDVLIATAKRKQRALAIAHPYAVTVRVLSEWDPTAAGVRLVSLSTYIDSIANKASPDSALASPECGNQRPNPATADQPYAQR